MASTSVTTAATEPRQQSDDDERGIRFFFGRMPFTLAKLGLRDGRGTATVGSPDHARAHAAGRP